MIAREAVSAERRGARRRADVLRELVRQFGWYLVNGGIATAVDWSVFALLKGRFGIDYRAAVTVSFLCGAACNFQLQKRVTFRDRVSRGSVQAAIYLIIVGVSLLATVGVMIGFVSLGMSEMAARVVTTANMTAANFLLHRSVTFNRRLYGRLPRASS